MTITIPTLEAIDEAARQFLDAMDGRTVFAFEGGMGAGKTTFIRALCRQLGVTDTVTSPTFAIVNEYSAPAESIYHFDFYRLKDIQDAVAIGLEDYLYGGSICLIEWPGLVDPLLPDDTVRDTYRITLTGETAAAPDLRKLHQNLDEMFFSLQLRDKTRPMPQIWESAGGDTLRGLFLQKLRTLYDAAVTEAEKSRIEQAVRWGLAAMENGEEVTVHENP